MEPVISIAIVDDHPLFRKGVRDFLREYHIETVLEAGDGSELIDKLEGANLLPDICLMDVAMPHMNGFEATALLRKRFPSIKVIALSLYDHKYNIIQMLKNGAVAYLFKNGSPHQVPEAIHAVYDHGYYYSEVLEKKVPHVQYQEMSHNKPLNEKERTFLSLACSDLTYNDIAKIMSVSPRTVDGYRDSLFAKLNLKSRAGLVLFAIQTGIVDIGDG